MNFTPMNVAIYARHSSDKQNRLSSEDQIARCAEWCSQNNHLVYRIYQDEAITGALFGRRKGISRLNRDANTGAFDLIVCEDLSRLSRDQGDTANFHKRMSFLGVRIYSLTEGFMDRVNVGLKGIMNELYLEQLADKTLRGNIASVRKGNIPGRKIYGYDFQTYHGTETRIRGKRQINEVEAAIVKTIFRKMALKQSVKAVVDYLNDMDIPSPQGKKWTISGLTGSASRQAGLLRQTLYKGVLTFNRQTYRTDPVTGQKRSFPNPREKWVVVPVPELAIIEAALFDRVQYILEANRRYTPSIKVPSELEQERKKQAQRQYDNAYKRKQYAITKTRFRSVISGKCYCSRCQQKLAIRNGGWLACKTRGCSQSGGFEREGILAAVAQCLKGYDVTGHFEVGAHDRHLVAEMKTHIHTLKTERAETRKRIEDIVLALEATEIGEVTKNILDNLETLTKRLTIKIQELEANIRNLQPVGTKDANTIKTVYENLVADFNAQPDLKRTQHALRKLVDHYFVHKSANGKYAVDMIINEKELLSFRHNTMDDL